MMNRVKKLLSMLLAVMMLLGMMQFAAFAEDIYQTSNAVITLTNNVKGTLKPGNTFTVIAEIENNPGYHTAGFAIVFNTAALKVTGYDCEEYYFGDNGTCNTNAEYGAFINTASASAKTKDRDLFELTFEVLDGAASGEYEIKIDDQNPKHEFVRQANDNPDNWIVWQDVTYVSTKVTVEGNEPVKPDAPIQVAGIELNKTALEFTLGSETLSETLTATVLPEDAENKAVVWSTSNAGVATVENGVVTAVGEGTATITVTTADGGFTAECAVTVNAASCEHTEKTSSCVQGENQTHTVTDICGACGEQVGKAVTEDCADTDADGKCDKCGGAVEVEEDETSGLNASIKGSQTVAINETAQVELFINSDNADEIYNAFKFEVSYDSSILTYSGDSFTNEAYNVSDNGEGKLIIDGYGDDIKVSGENALVTLKFTAKAGGEGKVEISKAAANDRGVAIESDVQPIAVSSNSAATITVNAPKEIYTVTFEGSGAGDANGESEVTEGDNYTFTVDMQPNYTYNITAIMGGVNYELNGGYTIENVNGNIVITVERTYNSGTEPGPGDPDDPDDPNTYNVTLPEGVIGEQTATSGEDYIFTVPAGSGVPTVTIGGNAVEIGEGTPNEDGSVTYTIPGEQIVGAIVVTLPESEAVITVEVGNYFKFDNGVMKLVVAQAELGENKVLTYEGKAMYWSEQYQGYAYLVPVTDAIEAFGAFTVDVAKANVAIADGSYTVIDNGGDVNMSGKTDINDAQLTYDIYKAVYSDFTSVSMEKMLRADVNNDRKVNVSDVTAVVDIVRQ